MIIDFHTHIFPPEVIEKRQNFFDHEPEFKLIYSDTGAKLIRAKKLIKNMDNEGIDKSVIFGFPWHKENYFKRHNDYIIDSVERYKDRLIGFGNLCPLANGAEKEIERCLKSGLSGIGELAFYTSGITEEKIRAFTPIAEIALQFDVPILLHTNEPVGHDYPGKSPMKLREILGFLKHFPKNKIILAHWGGGIFFYHLMKKEIKDVLKNTWFDTAASPYLYDKEVYPIAAEIVGPDRILFGSDFPLIKPSRYFKEMKESGLSQDAVQKICGHNATSLLKIVNIAE